MIKDIYSYVTEQETAYQLPIEPIEGWSWGMKDHIRKSALMKNSQFWEENENRTKRPYENIVLPLLNIQYRLEGFDVKDIDIYVTNPDNYFKSFLIKKYHEKWAVEHGMDTLIDRIVESYVDYGGVLVKNGKELEVVDLATLAFADQTDILSGAFAIKHYYSPEQLREQGAWNKEAIDFAILQAEYAKKQDKQNSESKTPTKYIEVYEVHGVFPDGLLKSEASDEDYERYSNQIHIISFYNDQNGEKQGITFFAKKEPELPFKFLKRDLGINGRALGRGGIEELFESQIWTNYSVQKIARLLDSASKTLHKTTDPQFKSRNNIDDLQDNSVLVLQQGTDIGQMDMSPRSLNLFEQNVIRFKEGAKLIAAGGDALLGETPPSGTPFALQQLITTENKGMHHHRRGQVAVFVDEIYRDWTLPKLAKEVSKKQVFLTLLSADELQKVSESASNKVAADFLKKKVFNDELVTQEELQAVKQSYVENFLKGGRKRFLEIIEGEIKNDELGVATNIAGKQKNLALVNEKLVAVVRQFLSTPQLRQDPAMGSVVNEILENAGISPLLFSPSPALVAQNGATAGQTEALAGLGQPQMT